jgi:hypothetical protein
MIDIKGIDKAKLLAALVNGTSPQGLGWLHANGRYTEEQAKQVIESYGDRRLCFDYVGGRPIKSDITGDEFGWGRGCTEGGPMIITIVARIEGREDSELAVEIAQLQTNGKRSFVARRTDMPVGQSCHVLVESEDDDSNEHVIARSVAAIVGLRIAKPRAPKVVEPAAK